VASLAAFLPQDLAVLSPAAVQQTSASSGDSPLSGDLVHVEGVVVAVSPHGDFWYLADPIGGSWSGVKVQGPALARTPGEQVAVIGRVREEFGETRILQRSVRSHGTSPLPPATTITAEDLVSDGEPWEGVLVAVDNVAVQTFASDFGEWEFSDATAGGAEVDDEFWVSYAPDPGDTFARLTGLVSYGFGDFRLEPRADADLAGWTSVRAFSGRLDVTVVDGDGRAMPSKVTLLPVGGGVLALGPDDRAEGSEDVAYLPPGGGEVRLPPGTYDVVVSRGPEYGLHEERVTVPSGGAAAVSATLRREVDTSGWISGDFHLHCAPSSDTALPVPGRVASLAAEGVEWAVATDHNMVTDYAPVIEAAGLSDWIRSSVGDEITTRSPSYGHFNAWPLARGSAPLPFEALDPEALFAAARQGPDREIVQVNHPSIPDWGNQYFDVYAVNVHTGEPREPGFSWSFDALEVFNGRYLEQGLVTLETWMRMLNRGRVITATGNSDSHHLVFAEPGYPRNFVRCDAAGPAGADEAELVEAVRRGAVSVSYGPFLTFDVNGAGPGELVGAPSGDVALRARVQCASWLEVDEVRVYANGHLRAARSVDFATDGPQDERLSFQDRPAEDAWYVAVAEGDGDLSPVRRGTGFRPFAFTNPVRVDVDGDGEFTPPGDVADLVAIEEVDEVGGTGVPLRLGEWVAVRGCATTDTRFLDASSGIFYVEDGTGGVQVREEAGPITEVRRGDALWVGGAIGQLVGETVLLGAIVQVEPPGGPCAGPLEKATGEIGAAGEALEGRVVRVRNVQVTGGSWPTGGAEGAVTLDDGSGPVLLVVPQGVVVPAEASSLARFDLDALATQRDLSPPYTSGYRLTLRSGADLPLDAALSSARMPARPGFGAPFPNPFRGSLRVPYEGADGTALSLSIHDVRGALVRRLEAKAQGPGEVVWDGRDGGGRPVAAGVYWMRLREGGRERSVKVVRVD
jgi:hypothetical protein